MHVAQDICCYGCGSEKLATTFTYHEPPVGETRFKFSSGGNYHRQVLKCGQCGHLMSVHEMDDSEVYTAEYVESTYGSDGFRRTFERIISLDPAKSDNVGRCERILQFAADYWSTAKPPGDAPTILDVGSGLCVFLHRMKAAGWQGTALDPDPRAAAHACEVVGVEAVCGDFFDAQDVGHFDAISLNKVLEHVKDPVKMLVKAKDNLARDGFVYVEVPDGEAAAVEGPGREEFFVEHHHIFSMVSLALVASRAGFSVRSIERLREPSTKFTLRAFLTLQPPR